MITEDNDDLRVLIAESLSDEFQVMQARDGVEALKLIEDVDFDLVISDIMMPHKDGVSLCNDIKKDMNTSHIPVILLTAKTSLESKIEGVDSGADLYFEKAYRFDLSKIVHPKHIQKPAAVEGTLCQELLCGQQRALFQRAGR